MKPVRVRTDTGATAQIIDNVQSIERNIQPAKKYRIGINKPSTDTLVSE